MLIQRIFLTISLLALLARAAAAVPQPRSDEELYDLADVVVVADVASVTHDGVREEDGALLYTVRFRVRQVLKGKYPIGALFRRSFQEGGNIPIGSAAAAEILLWRRQVLADLNAKGVLSLDVFPHDMTARLVNRYLEVKARHLL